MLYKGNPSLPPALAARAICMGLFLCLLPPQANVLSEITPLHRESQSEYNTIKAVSYDSILMDRNANGSQVKLATEGLVSDLSSADFFE